MIDHSDFFFYFFFSQPPFSFKSYPTIETRFSLLELCPLVLDWFGFFGFCFFLDTEKVISHGKLERHQVMVRFLDMNYKRLLV